MMSLPSLPVDSVTPGPDPHSRGLIKGARRGSDSVNVVRSTIFRDIGRIVARKPCRIPESPPTSEGVLRIRPASTERHKPHNTVSACRVVVEYTPDVSGLGGASNFVNENVPATRKVEIHTAVFSVLIPGRHAPRSARIPPPGASAPPGECIATLSIQLFQPWLRLLCPRNRSIGSSLCRRHCF
jgi:hypothetical protein